MIEIVLLGQPRGKERPRGTKTGRFYTAPKTRDYEMMLRTAAAEVMGNRPPLDFALHMDLRVVMPIAQSWPKKRQAAARAGTELPTKKPDLDNIMKMIDALNMVVWIDDSQIVSTNILKIYGDKPGLWISVKEFKLSDMDIFS